MSTMPFAIIKVVLVYYISHDCITKHTNQNFLQLPTMYFMAA